MYIQREIEMVLSKALKHNPVVALIGSRQCGKSTLAKHLLAKNKQGIYLDLERPSDLQKLEEAEWFLSSQKGMLICIDEIQRKPELFPILRSLADTWGQNESFLVLGSASRELLKQSSETLAGRISYKKLTPFLWKELKSKYSLETYIERGAFPRSLLGANKETSYEWREDFISTFLERDLMQWRNFTPVTMRRLWRMLAHVNGQTADYTTLAGSLGVSAPTIKNYIDLLESTFMVEIVPPYISNLKKRLVKSPKIYVADSGITATLLGLRSFEEMSGHPSFSAIWEQIVLTNLKGLFPESEFYFYRTTNGAEVDFVMKMNQTVLAIECKASYAPSLTKGSYFAFKDTAAKKMFVAAPVEKGWPVRENVEVVSLDEIEMKIRNEC